MLKNLLVCMIDYNPLIYSNLFILAAGQIVHNASSGVNVIDCAHCHNA